MARMIAIGWCTAADNSCLFAAVAHAFGGSAGRRERADGLRRVVADVVLQGKEEYSEAALGKPPHEYAVRRDHPNPNPTQP